MKDLLKAAKTGAHQDERQFDLQSGDSIDEYAVQHLNGVGVKSEDVAGKLNMPGSAHFRKYFSPAVASELLSSHYIML